MASSETSDMNPVGEDEEVQPRDACGVFGCVLTDLPSSPSAMMTSPSSASSLPYLGVDHAQTNYVPYTIYLGLVALQHRGQESAGIVTSDGGENELKLHKGHGLVSSIFSEDNLAKLHGKLGIGHTRYSTVGGQNVSNVQPFVVHTSEGPVAVAHNGELVNSKTLRNMVYSKGVGLASLSDSELITQILCLQPPDGVTPNNWPDRIKRLMHLSPISYSLVIMHNDAIYAVRDPHGNRPLCIGRILKNSSVSRSSSFHMTTAYELFTDCDPGPHSSINGSHRAADSTPNGFSTFMYAGSSGRLTMNGHGSGASAANGVEMSHAGDLHTDEETEAWIVSSESCAFRAVGAQFVREVEPGELVEVSNRGLKSTFPLGRNTPSPASLCIFEYVYFSRPDSIMEGQQIWGVRKRCGEQLARESPCKADLVSTVPESATPAALGFAEELGIPFTEVFCKNRYVGRTFIQPTTRARRIGIAKKFGVLSENVKGKSIVIVDDSIVRGTTIGPIVKMLKSAGATEVHIRIGSPPIKHPCRMGIHIPTRSELIANAKDAARLAEEVGAASLRYLTVEGLVSAVHSQAKPYPLTTARNSTLTSDPSSAGVVKLAADLKSLEIESSLNGHSDGSSTHKTAASTNGVTSNGSCGSGDLTKTGHCTACLTGNYPVALDDW